MQSITAQMCKTRQVSIFSHGIFRNSVTIWGGWLGCRPQTGLKHVTGLLPSSHLPAGVLVTLCVILGIVYM